MSEPFEASLSFAQKKDKNDPLQPFRSQFHYPKHKGADAIYFCGNSLGLLPKKTEAAFLQELKDWKDLAIGGYQFAQNPWLYYQLPFSEPLSVILGCLEEEVTVMNSLTVNLHLMLLSFYHPTAKRYKVIMEAGAFPSDQYAMESQIQLHDHLREAYWPDNFNSRPSDSIIEIAPRKGESIIREEDILSAIESHKDSLAMVMFGGINYYNGQFFDIPLITAAAHHAGAIAGFDLAHAVGNTELHLHDWNVDFAVWCSYKYLNGGPGATGGAFIHSKYARDQRHVRLGGWWGNEESTRFKMEKKFVPKANVHGWNQSTAPVFNLVALKVSLELFDKAGIQNLFTKSRELTAYLEFLLLRINTINFRLLTPADPKKRGAQLSLYFEQKGKEIHEKMTESGIVVDYREPGVIRVAPTPLYNSFEEVFRFFEIMRIFEYQ
jgi:kynureninase